MLKEEAIRWKSHDEGGDGTQGDKEEAFARSGSEKAVAELESRVKALRAL